MINGKAYPYLNAQPRRYRLRMLNGSQARFYDLHFQLRAMTCRSGHRFRGRPACRSRCQDPLLIAPGERFDVIVDFTGIRLGSTVMMNNDATEPYPEATPPTTRSRNS